MTLTIAARVTNGTPTDITVTAIDQFNNIATDYTGTIHFSSNDTVASLPPDYTFAPGDSGVRLFAGGVTMNTNGSHSITVADTENGALVVSDTVTVNP